MERRLQMVQLLTSMPRSNACAPAPHPIIPVGQKLITYSMGYLSCMDAIITRAVATGTVDLVSTGPQSSGCLIPRPFV